MEATNWHKPDGVGSAKMDNLEHVHAFDVKRRSVEKYGLKLWGHVHAFDVKRRSVEKYGLKLWGHGSYGGDAKVFYLSFDRSEAETIIQKLSKLVDEDREREQRDGKAYLQVAKVEEEKK